MKLLLNLALLFVAIISMVPSANAARDNQMNLDPGTECVAYLPSPASMQCNSSGFWSGNNYVRCSYNFLVRNKDDARIQDRRSLYGIGIATTNDNLFTYLLAFGTLGISEAARNVGNAVSANGEAKSDISINYNFLKKFLCDDAKVEE